MAVHGFKGFDKDMKCRGYQFEVGGDYEEATAVVCKKGFHACEDPMDVFSYYAPADSRYAEVECDGNVKHHDEDSKVACTKLHVGAEISLHSLIQAAVKFRFGRVKWEEDKESNTGYQSVATNTGYQSAATNTGNRSVATNTGYQSAATNTGYQSAATNTGDRSAASVGGKESIAIAIGYESKAKGALGCWIVLSEWSADEHIEDVQCAHVDGERIKPDVWYRLSGGEFVEAID